MQTATLDFRITLPAAPDPRAAALQRSAAESAVHLLQHLFERATPDEIAAAGQVLARAAAAEPTAAEPAKAALVREITGGRAYGDVERVALEAAALRRAFGFRRELLDGALSTSEAAALLGVSRQSAHERARRGTLLAVPDRGGLRFPRWQFDPHGPGGLVDGLPDTLRALGRASSLARVSWLSRPNPYLEGRAPVDALRAGETGRVLDAARAVGVD